MDIKALFKVDMYLYTHANLSNIKYESHVYVFAKSRAFITHMYIQQTQINQLK